MPLKEVQKLEEKGGLAVDVADEEINRMHGALWSPIS
jgi:hypothetical protein